ncbi:MAG: VOC family protein [Acidobacteriaceae bacterium]|nr:VOC family protein [Acidobacteriaceae bacterium]
MAKLTKKKTTAANNRKRSASPTTRKTVKKKSAADRVADEGDKLSFNHAMVYAKDVQRSLSFYHDLLGFKLVDEFRHEGKPVYARLRAPGGDGTIALHQAGPGTLLASDGVRLYFEIREVRPFAISCRPRASTSHKCRA